MADKWLEWGDFALGWNAQKLEERIKEIARRAVLNGPAVIPLEKRRAVARTARDLLQTLIDCSENDERLGLNEDFWNTLGDLARGAAPKPGKGTGRGGNRREGQPSLDGMVLSEVVRLYLEAFENPGFSKDGRLVRFANIIGGLLLGKKNPFSSASVGAKFNEMKELRKKVNRPDGFYDYNK
jgi:hypothetical protein